MFDDFPYTNMHQLNLDWIIKIAKDFLDQYTHIQELIANGEESLTNTTEAGLQQLQDKADNLETALQNLYNGYRDDLAAALVSALTDMSTVLASAISSFTSAADAKQAQVLDSIPEDYSALSTAITEINDNIQNTELTLNEFTPSLRTNEGRFIRYNGTEASVSGWAYSPMIPIEYLDTISYAWGSPNVDGQAPALAFYGEDMEFLYAIRNQTNTSYGADEYTVADKRVRFFRYNITTTTNCPTADQYLTITTNTLRFNRPIYTQYDYYNENNYVDNYLISNSGAYVSNNSWAFTRAIPVNEGDIVSYAYGSPDVEGQAIALALYDSNLQFIRGVKNRTIATYGADSYIIVDPSVKYIRYNIKKSETQYLKIATKIMDDNDKVFYVGASRSGRNGFRTIKEITEYIENNHIFNATVYLDNQTFNIHDELGSDFLSNYTYGSPYYSGPKFMNNTHFIGGENTKIYFWYNGANEDVYTYISPVNIAGDCILEGITIECYNGRYCVHDDIPTSGNAGTKYTVKYINCNMRHYGNTYAGEGHSPVCIGGGCNNTTRHIIDGGIFIVDNSETLNAISYHTYSQVSYGNGTSEVIIKNIYTAKRIYFSDYGDSSMQAIVNNNVCSAVGTNIPEARIKLYQWNNVTP